MELWTFVILGLVIWILSEVRSLRKDVNELRARRPDQPAPAPGIVSVPPIQPAAEPVSKPLPLPPPLPILPASPPPGPTLAPAAKPPPAVPARTPPEGSWEVALGARIASYLGIVILVIAVAFFVGYAIQHNLIGPAGRVIAGLLAGVALVGTGWRLRRQERFTVLARALSGGGSALCYFSVYAAHGMYELIGTRLATAALVWCAIATLGLAISFNSQAVALLGVLGAFLTPLLIAVHRDTGIFPLAYVALINVPVLMLGYRRNWQTLYNLAFLFTLGMAAVWLEDHLPSAWRAGLAFVLLFYAQFLVLGLLKAGQLRSSTSLAIDLLRMMVSALFLLAALVLILDEAGHAGWRGLSFFALAAAHALLCRTAWGRTPGSDESVVMILIALLFATLAVPAQFDGPWVALGWAVEGLLVTVLANRTGLPALRVAGFLVALAGLLQLVIDYPTSSATRLFLHAHFWVGLLSCATLFWQGLLHDRSPQNAFPVVIKILALVAALGLVTLELLRMASGWAGSLITLVWAASALLMTLFGLQRRKAYLRHLGLAVFALTVAKVFLVDLADLRGLQRIAAFFGVGMLLLILSYAYQRVAPVFLKNENPDDQPGPGAGG